MRILVLAPHPFYTHRGTPIAVKALIEGLVAEGHRITVLTYHQGQDLDIPGCEIRRIPNVVGRKEIHPGFSLRKVLCDAVMLVWCLRRLGHERFDLLHAVEESAFIALAVQAVHGVPFVYDMDSSVAQQMLEKYPALRAIEGWLVRCEGAAVRRSTGVLAVCQSLVDTARHHDPTKLVGKLEDVTLLTDAAEGGERVAELIGSSGPVVMYVGNLERYQGIDLLVDSFAAALAEVPQAHLVVIGGSAEHVRHYRAACAGRGLGGQVHFLGPRPVELLGHYLRQADVLVSPRIQGTNTAMKVYSYLDSGRAVLATRLLTHTQVLDDEISLLVQPEPAAMAQGLVRLLGDDGLRERLVERARQRVQEEFSPAAFRRKLAAFYAAIERSLADGRKPGPPALRAGDRRG